MSDIQEIQIMSDIPQEVVQEAPIVEETPKKARGRPAGAKNKAKPKAPPPSPDPPAAKPKPKPKAKKKVDYEEYDDSEEEKTPPPRRRAQQAPEMDRHALASDVLNILQQQRFQKTTARRDHYVSWFAN